MFTMELRSGGKLLATKIKKFKNQIKLQKIAVLMCPQSRFAIKNYKCKSYYQLCCTFSLFCLFMYFSLTLFSFSPPFLLVCALSYFHLNIQTSLTLSLSFSLSLMYLFHPLFSRFTEKGLMLWQYFCSYQLNTLSMDNLSRGRLSLVQATA